MANYIYALLDENDKPFYVGKTKRLKKRITTHKRQAKNNNPLPKYRKLKKILLNSDIRVAIIEADIPDDQVNQREQQYIAEFRRQGHQLYNLTDGGEGGDTYTNNPRRQQILEYRKHLRDTTDWTEKISEARRGQSWGSHTENAKRKISEARQGIEFSSQHKANLSIARKKRITTQTTKNKCSATSKGKINIKRYVLIDPDGNEHITEHGLTMFCEQHNLTPANMMKVLSGERKHHKGWRIRHDD